MVAVSNARARGRSLLKSGAFTPLVAGRKVSLMLSTCALLALAACSSTAPARIQLAPPAAAWAALPSPAELAERSAAFTEAGLLREGNQHEPGLPSNRVTVLDSDLQFTPVAGAQAVLDELAYAVYAFDVQDYDRELNLRLAWSGAPAPNTVWLALANFSAERWEWTALPAGNRLDFTDLAAHTSPAPNYMLYCAILVTKANATLDYVRVGQNPLQQYDEVEDNDSPAAANALTLPANGVRGSLGANSGAGYAGYDGDEADCFSFSASSGEMVSVTLYLDNTTGDIDIELLDSLGNVLDASEGLGDEERISYTLGPGEPAPYVVHCYNAGLSGSYSDYSLYVGIGQPTARLTATPRFGPVPLDVVLNAAASSDEPPGVVAAYEFDPEGDGTFLAPQASATLAHTYPSAGTSFPCVRVTDDAGNQHVRNTSVMAGMAYDEIEHNDEFEETNLLALPARNIRGSLGSDAGIGYGAYDGDDVDYFSFTVASDDEIGITLTHNRFTADIDLELYDSEGDLLERAQTGDQGEERILYSVSISDLSPLILRCVNYWSGDYSDYLLSVAVGQPTAVLVAHPAGGVSPLDVTLDAAASSDVGPDILTYEFDPLGNGSYSASQSTATYNYTYAASGIYHPWVRITDVDGNQHSSSATVLVDVDYDELEDNDRSAAANLLTLPVSGFRGSLGLSAGPAYPGYDSDDHDFFSFEAHPGDSIRITLNLDSSTGDLDLELWDCDNTSLAISDGSGAVEQITYTIAAGDPGPYRVYCFNAGGAGTYSDYTLEVITLP